MNNTIVAQVWDDKDTFLVHKDGENMKFFEQLSLPMFEIEREKYKYKFVDMQYLMESAIKTWSDIVDIIVEEKTNKVTMYIPLNASEQTFNAMVNIFMAMDLNWKKRGEFGTQKIFTLIEFHRGEPFDSVIFNINDLTAEHIVEYAEKYGRTDINYYALMVYLTDESIRDFKMITRGTNK